METNFQLLLLSPNLLKSEVPIFAGGGGFVETNFQLLFLSPNLLKSKVPIFLGGVVETNFQLLMLSPNLLKSKVHIFGSGGKGGLWKPISNIDAESKFAKIQSSHFWGGGGLVETSFQLLLLKSKVPISRVVGWWNQFPTFVVEVQSSHFRGGGEVGGTNFQLLMLSRNSLKKIFFCKKFSKFSGKNVPGNGFGL